MHTDDIRPVAIIPDPSTGKCSVEADNGERFQVEPADLESLSPEETGVVSPRGALVVFSARQALIICKCTCAYWRAQRESAKPAPEHSTRPCPNCGATMSSLLFMDVQPDGHVCPQCHLYVSPQGVALGTVIS